ncbi:MAG: hypothetical protein HY585_05640 [Candidatus Omnitrophica bacterium]|nr:hypothetical protein [Candidatus Omnitrophota bacterium]
MFIALIFFLIEGSVIAFLMFVSRRTDAICRAPGLDIAISLLTWIPWALAVQWAGWGGLLGCLVGQIGALEAFIIIHPILRGYKGPTIKTTINKIAGRFNNHLGLYATLPALPGFLMIRLTEICVWPILVWTMKFPKYRASEWITISRQKFSGLVGHDLVWCLYCDWMTGLYAFGGEMLRNLESFWCPIRFDPDKKCENCQLDFPDMKEWVKADGTIAEVQALLEKKYPPNSSERRSWYGHPSRKENNPSN